MHECCHWNLQLAFCMSSILLNMVTLPSALLYTVHTLKAQDSVFCILMHRHVAGYMEHSVLQHRTPKGFQVPKQQTLYFTAGKALQALLANCVGTGHLHSLNCQEAISQHPSSHQDSTHFTGKNVFAVHFTLKESSVQPGARSSGCLQTAWVLFHREFTHRLLQPSIGTWWIGKLQGNPSWCYT